MPKDTPKDDKDPMKMSAGEPATKGWAGEVFRERLRPELEEAERERARAFSLMWIPRTVQRKS